MNKQQLANRIWASANKMRSKIEAQEYKDFILGFIFYKFLSDKEIEYVESQGMTEQYQKDYLQESNQNWVKYCQDELGYFISYNDLFSTWLKNSGFNVGDVRDALNRFSRLINPSKKKVFGGIFDTLQNGLSKLGDNANAQTKAIQGMLQLIKDIPTDDRQDYDVLGFIYEYLIGKFASSAGKKAGEFYTPHEVALMMSEIVAHHLKDREKITIYDPTSGSGSLLLNIGRSIGQYLDKDRITYYAQELIPATYNLTRMNLVMRGVDKDNIYVRNGDTLEEDWPWFDDSDKYTSYYPLYCDVVVSNPPYSQNWEPKDESKSDPRYQKYGVAPKSKADYAFLLHDLYHLKPDGIMTIVLPHGVLFRGGSEEEIRKNLIEKNNIDAIIGLPANIFFGTGIPTIVMVLKQNRDNDDVLIVDASKGFEKVGNSNKLRDRDIRKIVDVVTNRLEIPNFSKRVSRDIIRENDYNLNIPRYVNSADKDEKWDINAIMFAGIPEKELEKYTPFWNKFPQLKESLFLPVRPGYVTLKKDKPVGEIIGDDHDVKEFKEEYKRNITPVADLISNDVIDKLTDTEILKQLNANRELKKVASLLFDNLQPLGLIDEYEAYQVLADRWKTISTDIEIMQTEGIESARIVDPNMVMKKKDGKEVEVQDGWIGRIIPIELVEKEMLSCKLQEVEEKKDELDALQSRISEILGNLPESEGSTPWVKDDGSAFVQKELKSKVKEIKKEYKDNLLDDSLESMLVEADVLLDNEKKLKKDYKTLADELEEVAIITIKNLTEEQILTLLKSKWLKPLISDLISVENRLFENFGNEIAGLADKYSESLTDIDRSITASEKALADMIGNLTGSESDLAGLEEFQKLLLHD